MNKNLEDGLILYAIDLIKKEVIDKAIKLIEKIKERRILRLLEMEVLDILKEVE